MENLEEPGVLSKLYVTLRQPINWARNYQIIEVSVVKFENTNIFGENRPY